MTEEYEKWLIENLDKLAEEFYGKPMYSFIMFEQSKRFRKFCKKIYTKGIDNWYEKQIEEENSFEKIT